MVAGNALDQKGAFCGGITSTDSIDSEVLQYLSVKILVLQQPDFLHIRFNLTQLAWIPVGVTYHGISPYRL